MSLLDFERIAPTFFIGLGGSGAKVVDRVARKLRAHRNWTRYRDLIHFVAVDTNLNDLNRHANIPRENRYLISDFDKRSYIQRKRGRQELDADPFVTSWVPDWYEFREEQGAGAGQIRIESRLSLFYNLEDDRARIIKKLHDILNVMTAPDNPWRETKQRVVRVFIYGSLAGGTGSGGFLTTTYLLRDLVEEAGWGRIQAIGTLLMPSLFTSDVEHVLHSDINANSYAALKELEHLMKLGYEDYAKELEFHYNPTRRDRTHVSTRPFTQVYLVDKPAELSIEQYIDAIADSAWLQLFGPIIGAQESEADNIVKRQKSMASGHFAVQYASYGCSVLILPRNDIVDYAALRYVERALDRYLVLGRDEQFRVPYDDKKFRRLSDEEKDRIVDGTFIRYIDHYAEREEQEDFKGPFRSIRDLKAPDGASLFDVFRRKLAELLDRAEQLVEITPIDPYAVNEQNTSLDRPLNDLRRDAAESGKKLDGYLDDLVRSLRSDRFWAEFFRLNAVQPLSQRYLLIKLMEKEQLSPYEEEEDAEVLYESSENEKDIDKDPVRKELEELQTQLRDASRPTLFDRLRRENVTFERKKAQALQWFTDADDAYRWALKRTFWQGFVQELRRSMETRLDSFRNVAELAGELVTRLREEARRFMEDPASREGAADATAYYMDVEVLMDDRAGRRLWDRFFEDRLDRDAAYPAERIFRIITAAFQPAEDEDGHIVAKDAGAIARDIRAGLLREGQEAFRKAIEDLKLDMESALQLEAQYVLAPAPAAAAAGPPAEAAPVPEARVLEYVKNKLQYAMGKAVVLAHIDRTKFDDHTVTPGEPFYACIAARYRGDEPLKLGTIVRQAADRVALLDDWADPDLVIFYRAVYGIPLYFYRRVNEDLYEDYKKVMALGPRRGYPLHTDARWEESLPNLEPREAKEAALRQRREEEARGRAQARSGRLRDFSLCTLLGHVDRGKDAYEWVLGEKRKALGASRLAAFEAFWDDEKLPGALREDFIADVGRRLEERTSSASARRRFVEELERHEKVLSRLIAEAAVEDLERDVAFLTEERGVIKDLKAHHERN